VGGGSEAAPRGCDGHAVVFGQAGDARGAPGMAPAGVVLEGGTDDASSVGSRAHGNGVERMGLGGLNGG